MHVQAGSKTKPQHERCCRIGLSSPDHSGPSANDKSCRNISLIGKAHEEKEIRQALLGLRPGHDVDVTVNFLA